VFVLSSRFEAFPIALVEALYCGASIVATRCSDAVEDLLEHGELGWVVDRADPAELAVSMIAAARERSEPERLRARAQEYSIERILVSYEGVLQGAEDRLA
jgi:glycosyltransferase involved in cell wall biosynthesis